MTAEVFTKLKMVVISYESRHWWGWGLWSMVLPVLFVML